MWSPQLQSIYTFSFNL